MAWLKDALGENRVTGYNFAGSGNKACLGSLFLSLVETGRFKYFTESEPAECSSSPTAVPAFGNSATCGGGLSDAAAEWPAFGNSATCGGALSDAGWFWAQVRACSYEIPPDGRFVKFV